MDKSSFGGYCLVPIYFVVTAVDVLHDEHEEIVVFVGEIYERQYNVNERAVGVMAIEAYVWEPFPANYAAALVFRQFLIDVHELGDRAVNPSREMVYEVSFLLCKTFCFECLAHIYDVNRIESAENGIFGVAAIKYDFG